MANFYYPNYTYPNYPQYQPPQIQPQMTPQPTPIPTPQNTTIQNGGFISVRSETEARNYPVAPGNSVTFFDETARYCYTKTLLSQLEAPKFEKYKLVKEEETPANAPVSAQSTSQGKDTAYALRTDLEAIYAEIGAIKARLEKPEQKRTVKTKKEEVDENV